MKKEFETIYLENKDSILRVCYMFLKDYHLAEDATQEVFIKVYGKINTFNNKSNIKTWITKIAINICKSKMRKKSYSEIVSNDITQNNKCETEIISENKLTLTSEIMNLSYDLREVTILFYYQDLSQKDISKILHISQTTVAYRLRKAREQLKNSIKEDFI